MSRSQYRRPVGRANVGGFRLDVRVEDKAVRLALRKFRKYAGKEAQEAMLEAVRDELPGIKRGVPLGSARRGHIRNSLVAKARRGQYPYLTAQGRHRDQLGVLEFGGTRRDTIRSKRDRDRVLWFGPRRHPRTMYVTKAIDKRRRQLTDRLGEIMSEVLQKYIDAAGEFKGRAG